MDMPTNWPSNRPANQAANSRPGHREPAPRWPEAQRAAPRWRPPATEWPTSLRRFAAPGVPWAVPTPASPLPQPRWLMVNTGLGAELGLPPGWPQDPKALARLAGNAPWPGYETNASPYAGHQFGNWVRQLGDGRALMLAELTDGDGRPQELQLKGAGPTPFARGSDGRAVWRSSIREALASEAMHALGVPTTRALSLVLSELPVQRDGTERAAVLCRSAPSFVRFGHFEYFGATQFARGRDEAEDAPPPDPFHLTMQRALADWVIAVHFPELLGAPDRHAAWLEVVIGRTAELIAQWQTLGFCHGVMNTDNFSILGLTLDYGPFAFMDRFRSHHVANASDSEGRYAWTAQPAIGLWNCERLLQACGPLLGASPAEARERSSDLLAHYSRVYNAAVMQRWRAKLGLREERPEDANLVNRLLTLMQHSRCDFTLTFRALSWVAPPTPRDPAGALQAELLVPPGEAHEAQNSQANECGSGRAGSGAGLSLRERFVDPTAFDAWVADYHTRLAHEGQIGRSAHRSRAQRMRRTNPLFILRNHLAQRVINAAEAGDTQPFHTLIRVLSRPFMAQTGMEEWSQPPSGDEAGLEISCSS